MIILECACVLNHLTEMPSQTTEAILTTECANRKTNFKQISNVLFSDWQSRFFVVAVTSICPSIVIMTFHNPLPP